VISGGKQYRVAPGDRILVDRLAGEPGSELTLDRVLMLADGDEVKIGQPTVEGATVLARVIGPAKGPKIDILRYKSKKRVRVHRGARAGLTAIEILQVGGKPTRKRAKAEEPAAEEKPKKKAAPRKRVAAKKPEKETEEEPVGA
jgi:large subunit ribosomal protein L21